MANTGDAGTKVMTVPGYLRKSDSTDKGADRVYSLFVNPGASSGVAVLYNSGVGVNTYVCKCKGTHGTGAFFNFGDNGILFPDGCYVHINDLASSVAITYKVEL